MSQNHLDSADIDLDGSRVTLDSPEPEGYLAWQYWAGLQLAAGRQQVMCPYCVRLRWSHLKACKHCSAR